MPSFLAVSSFVLALTVSASCVQLELLSTPRQRPANKGPWASLLGSNRLSLNSLASLASLGSFSSLRKVTNEPIANGKGGQRVRLIQTYSGYDVFGSSIEAEVDSDGYFSGQMHGKVARNLHKEVPNPSACLGNEEDIFNKVLRLEGIDPASVEENEKHISSLVFLDPKTRRGKFAYRVHVLKLEARSVVKMPVYFIEACTQKVILNFNGINSNSGCGACYGHVDWKRRRGSQIKASRQNASYNAAATCDSAVGGAGGNRKTRQRTYGSPPLCLNAEDVDGTSCKMSGKYSKVVDNLKSDSRSKQDAVQFTCRDGYSDAVNGAFGVASDLFYYAESFGCFYQEKYRIRPVGGVSRYVAHYGENLETAFYNYDAFFFGDGGPFAYPLSDHSVVAHETAHAVTYLSSGLLYRGQSGGIGEAFADISSEAFEHYLRGSHDWVYGWEVMKRRNALRVFDNPRLDGVSINSVFQYRSGLDVHHSSGIYRHAFYQLVEKEGMDIFIAYKCFLDANLLLWTPFTTFREGACQVVQACYDNGFNFRKVRRAFLKVGIPLFMCDVDAVSTSMFVGESRSGIYVGKERAPVLKVDLKGTTASKGFTVEAIGISESVQDVRVVVGTDAEVRDVMAAGAGSVRIDNADSHVYVKLVSESQDDVQVTLKISEAM